MESLCRNKVDLAECNKQVHLAVNKKLSLYGPAAALLLSTYPVSLYLNNNKDKLSNLVEKNEELPYLLSHYNTLELKKLLNNLVNVLMQLERTPTLRSG